jgi:hypothetical protein
MTKIKALRWRDRKKAKQLTDMVNFYLEHEKSFAASLSRISCEEWDKTFNPMKRYDNGAVVGYSDSFAGGNEAGILTADDIMQSVKLLDRPPMAPKYAWFRDDGTVEEISYAEWNKRMQESV